MKKILCAVIALALAAPSTSSFAQQPTTPRPKQHTKKHRAQNGTDTTNGTYNTSPVDSGTYQTDSTYQDNGTRINRRKR